MGTSMVFNANDATRGLGPHSVAPQIGPVRIGVGERVDVGITSFFGFGLRADVKVMLSRATLPFAIAVRAGAGAAWNTDSRSIAAAYAGGIASYTFGVVEPFVAVTFMNHWIFGSPAPTDPLPAGQTYAPRAGYGDGLLQLALGVRIFASARTSVAFEYARWEPVQNDPGDGYSFIENDILSFTVCVGCPSRSRALARALDR